VISNRGGDVRNRVAVRTVLIAAIVILLAILIVMTLLLAKTVAPPGVQMIEESGMTWVRSIYGFGPSADEQFAHPYSVAVGSNGDIYATDPERSRVLVFQRWGDFKRILHTGSGGKDVGMFQRPESIALDPQDNLYIADSWANKVIVFDLNGDYVREWQVPGQPRGIAVTADEVFVLGPGTVYVYSDDGELLRQFGTRGKKPGQIDAYQGIAVREDMVYIADSYNRRIQAFDTHGTLAWSAPETVTPTPSLGSTTTAEQAAEVQWDLPQDLTFDGKGNLVVADAFRFQLMVVDPDNGDIVGNYGEIGVQDGEFYYPTSVAYDSERDWFVVADTQNQRLQVVRLPGTSDSPLMSTARRVEASPWRFLALPVMCLVLLFVTAIYKWIRWSRGVALEDTP